LPSSDTSTSQVTHRKSPRHEEFSTPRAFFGVLVIALLIATGLWNFGSSPIMHTLKSSRSLTADELCGEMHRQIEYEL
jgi:hypothetical protein